MDTVFLRWPKHFVYISPPKIDELFGQIPTKVVASIAKKLTVDLKLVKAEFGAPSPRPDTIYSRLRIVLDYIERQSMIGSVDQPGPYFGSANFTMRWGPYRNIYSATDAVESPLTWFAGETDATLVGLGGSVSHLVGHHGDSPTHSHSATPHLLRALSTGPETSHRSALETPTDWELAAVELANRGSRGTPQALEFVARRLLWGSASDGASHDQVLLGTPLYVSLAN